MRYRELRRRCDRYIRTLVEDGDLPDPFTLDEFIARVAARRGRRIELYPNDYVPGGVCGMWLKLPDADVILYARTAPLHQEHIVLHEVGHMFGNHGGRVQIGEVGRLLPDLDPAMVQSLLGRSSYTDAEEQEAELLATLLLERVADRRPGKSPVLDAKLLGRVDRLKSTFGG